MPGGYRDADRQCSSAPDQIFRRTGQSEQRRLLTRIRAGILPITRQGDRPHRRTVPCPGGRRGAWCPSNAQRRAQSCLACDSRGAWRSPAPAGGGLQHGLRGFAAHALDQFGIGQPASGQMPLKRAGARAQARRGTRERGSAGDRKLPDDRPQYVQIDVSAFGLRSHACYARRASRANRLSVRLSRPVRPIRPFRAVQLPEGFSRKVELTCVATGSGSNSRSDAHGKDCRHAGGASTGLCRAAPRVGCAGRLGNRPFETAELGRERARRLCQRAVCAGLYFARRARHSCRRAWRARRAADQPGRPASRVPAVARPGRHGTGEVQRAGAPRRAREHGAGRRDRAGGVQDPRDLRSRAVQASSRPRLRRVADPADHGLHRPQRRRAELVSRRDDLHVAQCALRCGGRDPRRLPDVRRAGAHLDPLPAGRARTIARGSRRQRRRAGGAQRRPDRRRFRPDPAAGDQVLSRRWLPRDRAWPPRSPV